MSYLDAKTPLERIADALEKLAGIDQEGGGIVGNLADGVTIHESDWIGDEDSGYHVEVEPYILVRNMQYTLHLNDAESDTVTATLDELERKYVYAVFFEGDLRITYDSEENRTVIYTQSNEEVTLCLEQYSDNNIG